MKFSIPANSFKIIFLIIVLFLNSDSLYGENWWSLYFTSPGNKEKSELSDNTPENAFIKLLKNTKNKFYGAFFEISSREIIQEIIKTRDRGVDVKLVIEKDNLRKKEVAALLEAGIRIITDNRKGFMHNKFAIFDERILWTGSYNLTYNDGYKNNNNVVVINSGDIAAIYLAEFQEMFDQRIFGNRKELTVFVPFKKKYYVNINGTDINVYFSPEDNIERIILERLKKAEKSVYFMAFSFTSDKLGDELIKLKNKGIEVQGIIEKTGSNSRSSEFVKLKLDGIQIRTDKNKYRMHHKVIIIDEKIVITGSYNFSKNANEKNDENIIILSNRDIAELFFKEFLKLIKK